jgi:salicylate hydroxylase
VARSRTLIVAGAGIGGLASTISLSKAGYRVIAVERAPKIEEIGTGIQLSSNATRALDQLGVLDSLRERAVVPEALIVSDAESGAELVRTDLKTAAARFGSPWLLVSRTDLQRALMEAASDNMDIVLEPGTEVTDFADHPRGVTVSTRKGGESGEHVGAALIGADGLRSPVRARLHGKQPLQFQRLVAWRALVPAKNLPDFYSEPNVRLWFGSKAHIVYYPVARGEMINIVIVFVDSWQGEDGEPVDISKIPRTCENWTETPQYLIATAKKFHRWALYDRPPLQTWGKSHVTLLGDAAHPMLPFVAQGAAAAIEDAVAIARHLKNAEEIAAALRAYETERAPRTAKMQATAQQTGRAYHASGLPRLARNFILKKAGGDRLLMRHAWIYRHGVRT